MDRLQRDVAIFCRSHIKIIIINLAVMVLAYGYFITNWTLSIDGENSSFRANGNSWLSQGRIIAPLLSYLIHFRVIPYFNNLLAVSLILVSSLIWATLVSHKLKCESRPLLVFLLLFNISPIYAFILQFTMCNVLVFIAMLFSTIAIYYTNSIVENPHKPSAYLAVIILLYLGISLYEMFAVYYISSIIFISIMNRLNTIKSIACINYRAQKNLYLHAALLLLAALVLYKLLPVLVLSILKIQPSGYKEAYLHWGRQGALDNISNIKSYIVKILKLPFDFYLKISMMISLALITSFTLRYRARSFKLSLEIMAFLLSGFLLVFACGDGIPLRTMSNLPLFMAGISLILFLEISSRRVLSQWLMIALSCCVYLNSSYINELFYGDNMRLIYDSNFANRLYNAVIDQTGTALYKQPLAIVGKHSNPDKPFILKSPYDAIGYSFFEWDGGNYIRIYQFMRWLGDDYIMPSPAQQDAAVLAAADMPDYPEPGSIRQAPDMIIVKLSASAQSLAQTPITRDWSAYKAIDARHARMNLDQLRVTQGQLALSGWAYIKNASAYGTHIYLHLFKPGADYLFASNSTRRADVAATLQDGSSLEDSGFTAMLDTRSWAPGAYQLSLIISDGTHYCEIATQRRVEIH
jgi:hypothetical protein